ncbi:MAG TPA: type II secretion system protein [Solirubrobacteraceae bacterium]|nr:type II secretion system protein [Solirubrobacteraceae bacterium]
MRQSLHAGEDGFTLIELLMVVVIVGLLAGLALPSFLQAAGDGDDAPAKAAASTAQLATEALAVEHAGSYATTSRSALHRLEPAIAISRTARNAYLSAASGTASSYTLTVTSIPTGDKFSLTRQADGMVVRACKLPARGAAHNGCNHVKGTSGSW